MVASPNDYPVVGYRSGQTLTAETSAALLDAFAEHPGRTNTLITYESELLRLNASGKLKQPLEIVHPADGSLPAGQTYHVAGPTDDGWIIVAMWDSRVERRL